MTTSGPATPGGGTATVTNTYGYDLADRLTSWTTTPPGGSPATHTYGYDGDGNLVNDNGVTQTYDARDELISESNGNTYPYTVDGDPASQAGPGGSSNSTTDAYGSRSRPDRRRPTPGTRSAAW
jgi:large repetitive protein